MTTPTTNPCAPVFGSAVTVTHVFHRRERSRWDARGNYNQTLKVWEPWAITPRAAIFLGWRTLINGVREWEHEVGAVFVPDKDGYIKAALVCFSSRENPVYVPVDALDDHTRDAARLGDATDAGRLR